MPRRKPFSNKQKKSQLLTQRAKKRGDESDDSRPATPKPRRAPGRSEPSRGHTAKLESKFVSLPPHFLERTRDLAFSEPLDRPLPSEAARFPLETVLRPEGDRLKIPARPKFRYGQTKKEVEKNEEGVFRTWLQATRGVVEDWVNGEAVGWPRSPSWFETNLEVWRQLWRVIEASAIVLLLIDSRCPPVHCPPSLRAYLKGLKVRRQIILVLTKSDLVDAAALEGWRSWLKEWWGDEDDVQVVNVVSYDLQLLYESGRRRHRPAIPSSSRMDLVAALKIAHERLLQPPTLAKADPVKLAEWRPSVRSTVDWSELADEPRPEVRRPKEKKPHPPTNGLDENCQDSNSDSESEESTQPGTPASRDPESEPLTIGLVGQPNVGKSSLLNALMGTTRVRASKTPGKTKHFQTILWGAKREIKIVDCPGLVCPSLVPMELQAMAGILPISQIPSLPSCIHFVAQHMPLETIFRIPLPEGGEEEVEKRTWRDGMRPATSQRASVVTAGELMEARAMDRGYLTAKGGRPDANRAGNEMLRTIADGRVRWGFWPHGSYAPGDVGVWLGGSPVIEREEDDERGASEDEGDMSWEGEGDRDGDEDDEDEEDESAESEENGFAAQNKRSFFAALSLDDGDEDEAGDESEEDGEEDEH